MAAAASKVIPMKARASGVFTMTEKIGPVRAEEILRNNDGNRSISPGHVAALARDMKGGHWTLNGDTIKFGPSGELMDGQHRLSAVIESGKTIEFLVAYNVPKAAMKSIDRNRARSIGDLLRINRGLQYSNWIASVAGIVANLERGFTAIHAKDRLTYDEVIEVYDRYADDIDWAVESIGYQIEPGIPSGGGTVLGAFAFMHQLNQAKIEAMAHRFKTSEGKKNNGDPAFALRQAVASAQGKSSHVKRELVYKTLRCIEAELSGEKLYMAKVDSGIVERAVAARLGR